MLQKELEEEEAALDMDDGTSDTKDGSRMLRDEVTPDDIASVVASWTGSSLYHIPSGGALFSQLTSNITLLAASAGVVDLCVATSLFSRYPSRQADVERARQADEP